MPTQVPVIKPPSTPSKPETEVGNTPRLTNRDGGQGVKAVRSLSSKENNRASSKQIPSEKDIRQIKELASMIMAASSPEIKNLGLHNTADTFPIDDSINHDVFTAWANRAELDKEFLLLGHNLLKIDINRENLRSLVEILPKDERCRLSSLDNVGELIEKEDRAQRSSDKVRAKKIQLTRRIDTAVLVALKASTQLKKMTPDAIKDKQNKCKSELIQQLMSAYQEKHPSSKKSLDALKKELNTSEKVNREAKQRFHNWFEDQKHACKTLGKEVHSVRIKGKGLKEDYSNGNKRASDFFAVMDELLKTYGLKLNAWGDQAQKTPGYGVSSSKDLKEVVKGWISGSSVKEVPFKVDNVLKGIQSLGHKLSVQDAKLYRSVNDPTTASVTQSILWDLQQEALRFQYDCVPLMSVIQSIKKSPILQAQKILSGNDLPTESPKKEALKTLEPSNIEDFIQSELEGSQETRLFLSTELSSRTEGAEKTADLADVELSEDALIARMERMCTNWSDSIPKQEEAAFNDIADSIKHKVIPNMVSGLGRSSALLRDAAKLATNGDMKAISLAEVKVKAAVSQAKSVVEDISFSAAEKTGRAIDPFSARSRIAKDWAMEANDPKRLAKSLGKPKESIKAMTTPDVHDVQKLLQGDKVFHGLKSGADPEFILFATRVAQECLRAEDGRTIMPMSPEECAHQEKVFLEFLSNWGQRKALRGIAIALLEDKAAVATLGISQLVRALSIVLFGGITTALKVHNAKKGLMPNNDYPYKAVQQILSKNIQQLAFRLVMTALPNTAQSAIGGGLAMAGRAHNAQVDWSGEGKKLELKNIIESAVEEAVRSTVPDGLEAIVNAHVDESIEIAFDDIDEEKFVDSVAQNVSIQGDEDFKGKTREALITLSKTEDGRTLLNALRNSQEPVIIRYADGERAFLRQEGGKDFYASSTDVKNRIIYFDPWNTLAAKSRDDIGTELWRERDPSIALFHEVKHILDHDASNGKPTMPNLSKLTENGYRKQFYALNGETAVLRDDDRHGHRSEGRVGYARARQLGPNSVQLVSAPEPQWPSESASRFERGPAFIERMSRRYYSDRTSSDEKKTFFMRKVGQFNAQLMTEDLSEDRRNYLEFKRYVLNDMISSFGVIDEREEITETIATLYRARKGTDSAENVQQLLNSEIRIKVGHNQYENILVVDYLQQKYGDDKRFSRIQSVEWPANLDKGLLNRLNQDFAIMANNHKEAQEPHYQNIERGFEELTGGRLPTYVVVKSKSENNTPVQYTTMNTLKYLANKDDSAEAIWPDDIKNDTDALEQIEAVEAALKNLIKSHRSAAEVEEKFRSPVGFMEQRLQEIAARHLKSGQKFDLDTKVTVRFKYTAYGDNNQDDNIVNKEYTLREVMLGKPGKHAADNTNGLIFYFGPYYYEDKEEVPEIGIGGVSQEEQFNNFIDDLTSCDIPSEYDAYLNDLSKDESLKDGMNHLYKNTFDKTVQDLGVSTSDVSTVSIPTGQTRSFGTTMLHETDHYEDAQSAYVANHSGGAKTFFSPLSDKQFKFSSMDAANRAYNDKNSDFYKWLTSFSSYRTQEKAFNEDEHIPLQIEALQDDEFSRYSQDLFSRLKDDFDYISSSNAENRDMRLLNYFGGVVSMLALPITEFIPVPPIKWLARILLTAPFSIAKAAIADTEAEREKHLTDAFVGAILTTTFTGAKLSTGSNAWLGQLATSAPYIASVQWHDGKNLKGHIVSGVMAGHRNVRPDPGQREKQLEAF